MTTERMEALNTLVGNGGNGVREMGSGEMGSGKWKWGQEPLFKIREMGSGAFV